MTLSMWFDAAEAVCGPGLGATPPRRRMSAGASVSLMSELLPEPLTPVTPMNRPSGNVGGDVLQVVRRHSFDDDAPRLGRFAPLRWNGNRRRARQVSAGDARPDWP